MPKYEIGRYEVEIVGQGFTKASTGNMQFVLEFKVIGKIDPADPNGDLIGVMDGTRKYYKAITENTVEWLMDDLKSMGVEGLESWAQLDPATDGFIDLSGKHVDMACGSKAGQDGKSYEDWSVSRGGGGGKPIAHAESKDVKALDRLFGKHLLKKASAGPQRQTRQAAPASPPVAVAAGGDDDVPF